MPQGKQLNDIEKAQIMPYHAHAMKPTEIAKTLQ